MQTRNGQNLTYDYQKLDEYLNDVIDPLQLDRYFRNLTSSFAQALLVAFNEKDPKYYTRITDSVKAIGTLDEFFRILGTLEKGGES